MSSNISSSCLIASPSKSTLRKKIWKQWREIMQNGNIVTPAFVHNNDKKEAGDIWIDEAGIESPLRVNNLYVIRDDTLITQNGFLLPLKTVKRALSIAIDSEIFAKRSGFAIEYTFDAWFVKAKQ
jgi:hypothetical protein